MTIDVVMPARDESATIAANVAAATGCRPRAGPRCLLTMLRPFGDLRWRAYSWYLRGLRIEKDS